MSSTRRQTALGCALLTALAAAAPACAQSEEGSGGGSISGSQELDFSADLAVGAAHRRSVSLDPDGPAGSSGRVTVNLTWSLRSPRTSFFANLNPYYDAFFSDRNFSTYGGTAGLGVTRQQSPRVTWTVSSRFAATPEQDTPQARVAETEFDPEFRFLVQRNGFFNFNVDGSTAIRASDRTDVNVRGSYFSRQYDVYNVDSEQDPGVGESDLVSQRRYGLGVGFSTQTSERNTWSADVQGSLFTLSGDPNAGPQDDDRSQAGVSGSYGRALSERTTLSLGTGFSVIQTGPNQGGQSTPTLDVGLAWRGERQTLNGNINRNQGIFPTSSTSVDATTLRVRYGWEGERRGVNLNAGYGIARRAGDDRRGEDTSTINFDAIYNHALRTWSWFASVFYNTQRTDAPDLGRPVDSIGLAAGLAWNLTGGTR